MNINCTDRYPGLRYLVEERRLVPIHVRLVALGGDLSVEEEEKAVVEEVRQSTSLHGRRTVLRDAVAGASP